MRRASLVIGCGLTLATSSVLEAGEEPRDRPLPVVEGAKVERVAGYGRLPLRFEQNEATVRGVARYVARGRGYALFVTSTEMTLALPKGDRARLKPQPPRTVGSVGVSVLRVKLLKARRSAELEGLEELPGKSNYFVGSDPKKWRLKVPAYAQVRCREVYPGIDLVYHGTQEELEYDFVIAPRSDPRRIRLGFEGGRGLRLDGEGNLVVSLERGEVVKRAPRVYQQVGSRRKGVRGRWVLHGRNEAGFEVGAYDTRQPLVIDPVLSYSTYLGGDADDLASAVAVDGTGSAYVTGQTLSTDFPTLGPYQTDQPSSDVFVAKFSPLGNNLVYSTYLGGSADDSGLGIAVDSLGSAYVIGVTYSTDFPTQNPYQTDQSVSDAFVTKLSPSGDSLVYSTYLGGSAPAPTSYDVGYGIAVDASGSAYVTGYTNSTDFPTQNPYQTDQPSNDAFVTKLSPSGNSLVYSTYLGGTSSDSGASIVVDGSGSAYVTGETLSPDFPTQNPYQTDQPLRDAFVTKLSPSGNSLIYSTYLGGNDNEGGVGIAVDVSGSAYVTGTTRSTNFPTQSPYQLDQPLDDVFVTKLSPSGNSLLYSTYLGGNADDYAYGIAVDGVSNAYLTGVTLSTNFPTQAPYQEDQTSSDAFVTKLSSSGNSLVYSTYLGGSDSDGGVAIAVDGAWNAYVIGNTFSTNFPTQDPYQTDQPAYDVFVTKLVLPPMDFFTLSPCRLVDTRNAAGPLGGPALNAGTERVFTLVGSCGLPATAQAVSVNLAVTAPSAAGNLRLYPAGAVQPLASFVNYAAGQTRANNAVVTLDNSGALAVRTAQASGTVHFVLDVNGYFQ